ncbi:MAG: translation initiation factor IF-3 [Simkaniaceae bacterium]|nr:translation initiation factor IF-3 [Simkaniaceae bacterium]
MRTNREIRAKEVRVIGADGEQAGILSIFDAMKLAEEAGLDLVEIAPTAKPPVCKIIDYGKFRYQQAKKEKESKKAQHQIKVKEIKVRPNIDDHDLDFKKRRAHEFLSKGFKVKLACFFRGREMMFQQKGRDVLLDVIDYLKDLGQPESMPKMMGRSMIIVMAPTTGKTAKKKGDTKSAESQTENKQSS